MRIAAGRESFLFSTHINKFKLAIKYSLGLPVKDRREIAIIRLDYSIFYLQHIFMIFFAEIE